MARKKKLANRSDRQADSAGVNRSGRRGRRSPVGSGATVRAGLPPKELRQYRRSVLKLQHKEARREAEKHGLKLVTEKIATLIRAAGGPPLAPVAPRGGQMVAPELQPEMLTEMPQFIVARIQNPPPEWLGLKEETIVMLAVEEWKAAR